MEDWAEIRRLHRAEKVPIREVARRLGISRNTVRAALVSERPPQYERKPRGSVADAYEPQIRVLLAEWPKMAASRVCAGCGESPKASTTIALSTAPTRCGSSS